MVIVHLGSDHGGFVAKEEVKQWLERHDFEVDDNGAMVLEPQDDYPLVAASVAEKVAARPGSKGILLCRTGVGVALVANKFAGVRAIVAWNPDIAIASRRHEDTNVLCLPSDYLPQDAIEQIVDAWLATDFSGEERHVRRLEEITKIEQERCV